MLWLRFGILILGLMANPLPGRADSQLTIKRCPKLLQRLAGVKHPIERIDFESSSSTPERYYSGYLHPVQKSLKDWIKRGLIRNDVGARIFDKVANSEIYIEGNSTSSNVFMNHLRPGQKYTFVVHDRGIVVSTTSKNLLEDLVSKHFFLARHGGLDGRVRMAGELWLDSQGALHFDDHSGTYRPNAQAMLETYNYFLFALRVPRVHAHRYNRQNFKNEAFPIAIEPAPLQQPPDLASP
ncbi:MAG TPA: hypothetical protein VM901_09535 [Bdellovibrionota bacterium]|jgi:hypothetical protein|nr:hypothetical protein [Bdellovibrionota bacterium]